MSSEESGVYVVVPSLSKVSAGIRGHAAKEARTDRLPSNERWGQLIPLAGAALVASFFVIHLTRPTGFFTSEFGQLAELLLYGMLAVGVLPFIVRLVGGSKNAARPFEIVSMGVGFIGQLYYLIVFPFNFAYFAAPLPGSLEFLLDWVPAELVKWILGIGIVGSVVFSACDFLLYRAVKKRLAGQNDPVDQKKDDNEEAGVTVVQLTKST